MFDFCGLTSHVSSVLSQRDLFFDGISSLSSVCSPSQLSSNDAIASQPMSIQRDMYDQTQDLSDIVQNYSFCNAPIAVSVFNPVFKLPAFKELIRCLRPINIGHISRCGFAIPRQPVFNIATQLIQSGKVIRAGFAGNSSAAKAGLHPTRRDFAGNLVLDTSLLQLIIDLSKAEQS
ncbi:protease Do-like 8, chloroplastic [Quillaja saponaria]|uniref:Protease Do-like 8, chloroplastic n=1 Tax=Quillaja saponaria TaxID=32244 RepID=A0AAD7PXH7_QUISA|nr:protease Do-like 8, chloroplastic [Quillaja saponaria]